MNLLVSHVNHSVSKRFIGLLRNKCANTVQNLRMKLLRPSKRLAEPKLLV